MELHKDFEFTREELIFMDRRATLTMMKYHPEMAGETLKEVMRSSIKSPDPIMVQPKPKVEVPLDYPNPGKGGESAWHIMEIAAKRHGLNINDLRCHTRIPELIVARQEAMYQCARLTVLSYSAIGRLFGRDHTTIMHGVRAHIKRTGEPSVRGISGSNGGKRK
jgi:hypothetical protein